MTQSLKQKILRRLEEASLQGPKRSLGQNFLISQSVVDRIIHRVKELAIRFGSESGLIEVGPGLGALTDELIEFANETSRSLKAIELDQRLAQYWRDRGLQVVEGDALKTEWPRFSGPSVLVSNLPYQISSSLVIERSIDTAGVAAMVLMFQKEVAQRLTAQVSTSDYGLLSVIAQLVWDIEKVSEAGPGDFWPAPRVASRVLQFRLKAEAPSPAEMQTVLKVAKVAYSHRRKLLVSNLDQLGQPRDKVLEIFSRLGLRQTARAEELAPGIVRRLSSEIFEKSE